MPLLLVDTSFKHRLTDLHSSKLIMTVPTFRDVSKFSSVDTANITLIFVESWNPCVYTRP